MSSPIIISREIPDRYLTPSFRDPTLRSSLRVDEGRVHTSAHMAPRAWIDELTGAGKLRRQLSGRDRQRAGMASRAPFTDECRTRRGESSYRFERFADR